MENQHRKITGYRDLSEDEVTLINHCKEQAAQAGEMVELLDSQPATDKRALALAQDHLQTGFMWLVRSVARPDGF